jgi:hypothetical protein
VKKIISMKQIGKNGTSIVGLKKKPKFKGTVEK